MSNRSEGTLRKALGQRVRALRRAAGLSQMALGEAAGLDHTYVGGIERGERNPTLEAIAKIATGLGVEIGELFRYSGSKGKTADESLSEILALLEGEGSATRQLALDLVRVLVDQNRR